MRTSPPFLAILLMLPLSAQARNHDMPAGGSPELTREQRMMLKMEAGRGDKQQRRAMMQAEMQKFQTMAPADRQNYQKGLQAKWDALPADQKQRLEADIAARRAARKQHTP